MSMTTLQPSRPVPPHAPDAEDTPTRPGRNPPAPGEPRGGPRVIQFMAGEGYPAIPGPEPSPWRNPPPVGPDLPEPEIEDPDPPTLVPPVHEPPTPPRPMAIRGLTPDHRALPPKQPHGDHFPARRRLVRAWRPAEPNGQSHQPGFPLGGWQRAG